MLRICHFEIHAENPERAAAFYRGVFGWDCLKWDGPAEYWLVTTGPGDQAGINGGIVRRMGAPPADGQAVNAYVCTLDVPSLDDYLAKALGAGATLAVPKIQIPGVGWLAYIKDTEGNIFGMIQNEAPK